MATTKQTAEKAIREQVIRSMREYGVDEDTIRSVAAEIGAEYEPQKFLLFLPVVFDPEAFSDHVKPSKETFGEQWKVKNKSKVGMAKFFKALIEAINDGRSRHAQIMVPTRIAADYDFYNFSDYDDEYASMVPILDAELERAHAARAKKRAR